MQGTDATRPRVGTVRSHDYHGTKMTGTTVVANSMILRNTNSTNRTRILSMVVDLVLSIIILVFTKTFSQTLQLLLIEWTQHWFFLSDVTGNAEQGRRAGTNQIQPKEHQNIIVGFVVKKVIMLQTVENHKCHLSSWNMKKAHQNTCMDYML